MRREKLMQEQQERGRPRVSRSSRHVSRSRRLPARGPVTKRMGATECRANDLTFLRLRFPTSEMGAVTPPLECGYDN